MRKKIPSDAFDYYLSLGPSRSYREIAIRYGVTKRGVAKCAVREGWQRRLAEARATHLSRENDSRMIPEALEELEKKATAALQTMTFRTVGEALDALEMAIRLERMVLSLPAPRRPQPRDRSTGHDSYERALPSKGTGRAG